jgi:signal transduction histidine kinase
VTADVIARTGMQPHWLRRTARHVLRVPLPTKLIGANAFVAVAAVIALLATHRAVADSLALVILAVALGLALLLNVALVTLALRPIRDVEAVAARVWRGDFTARVNPSTVADPELVRLGRTFNLLLESLAADRAQVRTLAAQTIRAQDDERSRIARELHDSAAQTIAALAYQLTATARDVDDPAIAARLAEMRTMAGALLEEVRSLSHTIHPRVLDDLGLAPALEWLARTMREHTGLDITVAADPATTDGASRDVNATLYRIAQESLRNVERHAGATNVRVSLQRVGDMLVLGVADDGRGFSLDDAESRRPGMGLFAMRERVALVEGRLDIDTAPGHGTRVCASIPATA